MKISGRTKVYAVLGHPVGHTLSPVMHHAAFRALGMDAVYLAFDVPPDRLPAVLPAMADMGFGGANLTVPLKEVALRGLPRLDPSAQMLGAVNTVLFTPDGLIGHNTDGEGFLRAFEESFGVPVAGKSVFVLGAGGAGRAVALSCAGAGASAISVTDLDPARAKKLAMELETRCFIHDGAAVTDAASIPAAVRRADIVIHATPVGMKTDDASPLGPESFRKGQLAFDLIYMHPETVFMNAARHGGAEAVNGLGMLLHQGAKAFELWTGVNPPVDAMRAALEHAVYGGGA